jgi:hypothetical protein
MSSRDAWAGPIQEWGEWRNRNLAIRIINVRVLQEQMRWAPLMRTLRIFPSYWICVGQRANVVHSITVAILAQGTSWAVAVTHAFLGLGPSPQASVRTLPAHAQAIFATAWTLARPRLWDRSPTGRLPSDHIHIQVGLASSSPPTHMPKGFLPMSGMPSESMGFPSSVG